MKAQTTKQKQWLHLLKMIGFDTKPTPIKRETYLVEVQSINNMMDDKLIITNQFNPKYKATLTYKNTTLDTIEFHIKQVEEHKAQGGK